MNSSLAACVPQYSPNKVIYRVGDKRVTLQQKLGAGAFGTVSKATDESTFTEYAFKDITCQDPQRYNAALKEIQTLYRISHDNVIKIIGEDYGYDDVNGVTHIFILTEYCAGGNLNERLNQISSEQMNFKWMRQAAAGLAYLYSQYVIHRDLKPDNVLLTAPTEDIKLADFGLAKELVPLVQTQLQDVSWLQQYIHHINSKIGMDWWMAPEVLVPFNSRYTEKSDVFSLGVLFYAILQRDFILDPFGKKLYGAFVVAGGYKVGLGRAMTQIAIPIAIPIAFSNSAQGSIKMQRETLKALQLVENSRPTAGEIHHQFEELKSEIQFWLHQQSLIPIAQMQM